MKIEKLSDTEKDIHNYVINNIERVIKMTVRELALVTFTNNTSIMRYCKKLGYQGFKDFQLNIKSDLKNLKYEDFIVNKGEKSLYVINKVKTLYQEVIDKTLELISIEQLEQIERKLDEVTCVDFIVCDANIAIGEYVKHYLFLMGKLCNIYSNIDEQILFSLNSKAKQHLIFIVSRSGKGEKLIKVTRVLKKCGFYIVSITQDHNTPIAKYSNEAIVAQYNSDFSNFGDCIFYTSIKFIFDCIIFIYYTNHFDQVLNKVSKYNEIFFE